MSVGSMCNAASLGIALFWSLDVRRWFITGTSTIPRALVSGHFDFHCIGSGG